MSRSIVNASSISALVDLILHHASLITKQSGHMNETQIAPSIGDNPDAGGIVPHNAVWDRIGHRVTQHKGNQ